MTFDEVLCSVSGGLLASSRPIDEQGSKLLGKGEINTEFYKPPSPIASIPFAGLNEVFKTKGSWDFAQHVFACTH